MRNDFAFMEASLAAGLCGAYVVPVNWHNTPDEARYVLAEFRRQGAGDPRRFVARASAGRCPRT